jgi:hypothetical protein
MNYFHSRLLLGIGHTFSEVFKVSLPVVQHQYSRMAGAESGGNAALDADGKSVTAVRMRPAEFFARTLAFQVRCELQAVHLGLKAAMRVACDTLVPFPQNQKSHAIQNA